MDVVANDKAVSLLGMDFIPPATSVVASAEYLVDNDLIG